MQTLSLRYARTYLPVLAEQHAVACIYIEGVARSDFAIFTEPGGYDFTFPGFLFRCVRILMPPRTCSPSSMRLGAASLRIGTPLSLVLTNARNFW